MTPLLGPRAGIGIAVAEIIDALSTLEAGPRLVPYALSARARLQRADAPPGTRFVPFPARLLLRSWARRDTPRIDRWVAAAQVVHATNYLTPPSRLPTLVSIYDCSFVRYPELCTPEVRALEPIVRRAVARGASIHTGSNFVADEIDDIFGPGLRAANRLVVIPLGVPALGHDTAMPELVRERVGDAPYVFAIGTFEPRKNFSHLVAAFGQLAARDDELHLVIAGHDGPARDSIDAAIERLPSGVAKRVALAGGVTDAGRKALLERAAALAYPSIYEGFGFPVLEAMSVGVPVVAARAGSIPEVAGDAALLVEPTDEHALASALEDVLTNETTRAELVARGHDRARAFSWDATARALAGCYRRLAEDTS